MWPEILNVQRSRHELGGGLAQKDRPWARNCLDAGGDHWQFTHDFVLCPTDRADHCDAAVHTNPNLKFGDARLSCLVHFRQ